MDLTKLAEIIPTLESGDEIYDTEDIIDENGEVKVYKTKLTTAVVTVVAYMMGMNDDKLEGYYADDNAVIIDELRASKEATIIRYLNRVRTTIYHNFKEIDNEIVYNLGNIDRMDIFNQDEIKALKKWDIPLVQTTYRADKYTEHCCKLIAENIDACSSFFPEWVNYDYIRDLFVVPKYNKPEAMREEYNKFKANMPLYPFQMYIHWKPVDCGNVLINDRKFLTVLYGQHGEEFKDSSKYHDAVSDTKKSIYDYINCAKRVVIVVDCENSDVYKLYGVLKSLEEDEVNKIEKIMLYDDYHTTSGWDWLDKFIDVPVEHIEVERVTDSKSLVDIRMTAGICESYYKHEIDSFILCSSDSDFWGVISSLPDADFLVLYEYAKCGKAIKDALDLRHIYHCSMDDFYTGKADELKRLVLKKELEASAQHIIGQNGWEFTKGIFERTHIDETEQNMKSFYEKHVKSLRLKMGDDGVFYVEGNI